jgi:hypothetical protein
MSDKTVAPSVVDDQAAKLVRTTVYVEPRAREALEVWAGPEQRSVSQMAAPIDPARM